MLEHVTGHSRTFQFAHPELQLAEDEVESLELLLKRRLSGEPIAYLTGTREFWSLPLCVSPGVLVPRPDTEILVEKALEIIPTAPRGCIIELGTGSGAIALALAQETSDRMIFAVEREQQALDIAKDNINRFGQERVQLVQGDWLNAFSAHSAAMIVSNPPYLGNDDEHLPSLAYEPYSALVSGPSGLEDLELIIKAALQVGLPGSTLLLEHGYEQAEEVRTLFAIHGYEGISSEKDLAGHERITIGICPIQTPT